MSLLKLAAVEVHSAVSAAVNEGVTGRVYFAGLGLRRLERVRVYQAPVARMPGSFTAGAPDGRVRRCGDQEAVEVTLEGNPSALDFGGG
jgi:hypothetical protein